MSRCADCPDIEHCAERRACQFTGLSPKDIRRNERWEAFMAALFLLIVLALAAGLFD